VRILASDGRPIHRTGAMVDSDGRPSQRIHKGGDPAMTPTTPAIRIAVQKLEPLIVQRLIDDLFAGEEEYRQQATECVHDVVTQYLEQIGAF
jgi:hypothetical protein